MLRFKKMSLFTGLVSSPQKPEFYPFILEFDSKCGLIVQKPSKKVLNCLKNVYKRSGGNLSTPLGKGTFGKQWADDVLNAILKTMNGNIKDRQILEFGCGEGYLLSVLQKMGANVNGYEPSSAADAGSREYGVFIQKRIFNPLEYQNEQFDCIYSHGVLEHVNKPLDMLSNIRKILKKDAVAFMAVPNCREYFLSGDINCLQHEHINYFTQESLKMLFRIAGFGSIKSSKGWGSMLYVWGYKRDIKMPDAKIFKNQLLQEKRSFKQFKSLVREKLHSLQLRADKAFYSKKTIGLYGGGNSLLGVIDFKGNVRLFDGDHSKHGLYIPGFNNSIEPPDNLRSASVDELWIIPLYHEKSIIRFLKKNHFIDNFTEIISVRKLT